MQARKDTKIQFNMYHAKLYQVEWGERTHLNERRKDIFMITATVNTKYAEYTQASIKNFGWPPVLFQRHVHRNNESTLLPHDWKVGRTVLFDDLILQKS